MNQPAFSRRKRDQMPPGTRHRARGSALVEYVVVTLMFVIVLIGGPNVLHQLTLALSQAYQSFTFVISSP